MIVKYHETWLILAASYMLEEKIQKSTKFGLVIQPLGLRAPSVPGGPPSIIRSCQFLRGNVIKGGPIAFIAAHTVTSCPLRRMLP